MAGRASAGVVLALVCASVALAGCSAQSAPPTPTSTAAQQRAACEAAADTVVDAVQLAVDGYADDAGQATVPAVAPASPTSPGDDPLGDVVARAVASRDGLGCDPQAFRSRIETGIGAIEPAGPIADAVWRRLSASVLGTARESTEDWVLEAGDDLQDALGRAVGGTTIVLPVGIRELPETLVLLDGVVLRGAGNDLTVLRSSAPEAAVLVATGAPVRLEDLAIELVGDEPASGVLGGPDASLALTGVRISGATVGEAGEGGAGVLLSASAEAAASAATTFEVTDSRFEDNDWAGIAVAGGHRASIVGSRFAGNGDVGAVFLDAASGSVTGSEFVDNGVGLAAVGRAAPVLRDDTITGGAAGVQVDDAAAPRIEGITVTGSDAAVVFGGESTGWIGGTTCDGTEHGIVIGDQASPTLGDSTCPVVRGLP